MLSTRSAFFSALSSYYLASAQ